MDEDIANAAENYPGPHRIAERNGDGERYGWDVLGEDDVLIEWFEDRDSAFVHATRLNVEFEKRPDADRPPGETS